MRYELAELDGAGCVLRRIGARLTWRAAQLLALSYSARGCRVVIVPTGG